MINKIVRNVILSVSLVGGLAACQKEKPKDVVLNATPTAPEPTHVNEMPALLLNQTDGAQVSLRDKTGKVLVICFNPDCDHCQREAKLISGNKEMLKDYEVYFISPETMEMIVQFSKDYNLIEPNIHFTHAEGPNVINALGPITTVPTFFVYHDQKQVARSEGEISLEKLKQLLN
jgi:thiol-disulfide isomerase/thioredoxin